VKQQPDSCVDFPSLFGGGRLAETKRLEDADLPIRYAVDLRCFPGNKSGQVNGAEDNVIAAGGDAKELRPSRWCNSLHDFLKSGMSAQTLEIRIVLNPVSYRNTRFKRTFETVESAVDFAEHREITGGIVKD
jgi:hypothetical protein